MLLGDEWRGHLLLLEEHKRACVVTFRGQCAGGRAEPKPRPLDLHFKSLLQAALTSYMGAQKGASREGAAWWGPRQGPSCLVSFGPELGMKGRLRGHFSLGFCSSLVITSPLSSHI